MINLDGIKQMLHYNVEGQKGKISFKDVLQPLMDGKDEIHLPGTKVYADPRKILHQTYSDKKIKGLVGMNNYYGDVIQQNGDGNNAAIGNGNFDF